MTTYLYEDYNTVYIWNICARLRIYSRWATYKKPTAQTAHLVFSDTKANAEKTKRAVFCQRSDRN